MRNFNLVSFSISLLVLVSCILLYFNAITAAAAAAEVELGGGEKTDRLALIDIKSKMHGGCDHKKYKGILESWNDSLHHCEWEGVTCHHSRTKQYHTRRVTMLDLTSQCLSGSLSPAIGNLSFLQELSLSENNLHGQIPPQIGCLSHLRVLSASNNSLGGELPANLSRCRNLNQITLRYNELQGGIPREFTSLTHLKILDLYHNSMSGTIDVLGNLTSLKILSVPINSFDGEIPATIGTRLKGLTNLLLWGNSFTGSIPSSIYNLSHLNKLALGGGTGTIHGSLPTNLGLTLPRLQRLQIDGTQIDGPLPASLSNLSDITMIDLAMNRLTGRIHLDGRNLPKLGALYLSQNQFLGGLDFIDSLVNCSHLYYLGLAFNQLTGVLPPSLANLTAMTSMQLQHNLISGNIPPSLDNLANLQVLELQENRLTGSIPDYIGKLGSLSEALFSENYFSGLIPASLSNLSEQLIYLDLGYNRLQGNVPHSLGELTNLQYLSLGMNQLTGEIPPNLFHASISAWLNLGENQFSGTLPQEIGRLQNLATLSVSNNKLSGRIPEDLGKCDSLTTLYMGGNLFSGSIPKSFSSLRGLVSLDLSHNNLSGQIPNYLSTFALVRLDLSFNNLEGEVPVHGVFANASGISLVRNKRLCGGITLLHLPKCLSTTNDHHGRRSKGKKLITKLLISISSFLIVAIVLLLLILKKRKFLGKSHNNAPSSSLGDPTTGFLRISYNMLLKATEGFSSNNLIGCGSFGSVYRGTLNIDGNTINIAAKVLNLQHRASAGARSFIRECQAMRNIRHRNLVSVISACSSIDFQGNDFKALVYELMDKGNLDQWLHLNVNQSDGSPQSLNLLQRINIAIDVACAIDYLHYDLETPVVHCDLKPNNILLDNDMVAHVGDFGLARLLLPEDIISQSLGSSAGIQGTIGYAPPEYGLGNQISPAGDVYSYGIIVLEIITAKTPTDQMFKNNTLTLHDFAKAAISSNNVIEIVDSRLADEITADIQSYRRGSDVRKRESLIAVIKVGVECSVQSPQDRMNIKDAIKELKVAKEMLMGTTQRVT